MKINAQTSPTNVDTWEGLRRFTTVSLDDILRAINGEIDFIDNCSTKLVSVSSDAADSEIKVTHSLKRIPNGYLLAGSSKAAAIYDGVTPATLNDIYIRINAVGKFKVLIF